MTAVKANVEIYGDWQNDVIESAVAAALESEHVDIDCCVEVIIADEEEIRRLNNENRGVDRVTDVLSFPMFERKSDICKDESGSAFLGSMVICRKRAQEQAKEYGHSVKREAAFLAVHSILHLLGYDHEKGKAEEQEMFSKQEAVLNSMGITR